VLLPAILTVCAAAPAAGQPAAGQAKAAYRRAVQLEEEGNYAAALSLLWEAAAAAPADADIQNRLGEGLDRIGALEAAVEAFERALAVRPGFRQASNNLVLTLGRAGRGADAVARARAIVEEHPQDADAHFTLGLALAELDIDQAIRTFRRVLDLAPRHALARYNLALVLKRADRLPEAIDELHRALQIEQRPEAHYTLGVIYWHQGDGDRAVEALRAAVGRNPRYADAHYTLGAVLKSKGEWRAAAAALERAIALRPGLWGAHYTLGQVLRSAGDTRGAQDHVAEAERLRLRAQREQEAGVWTAVGTRRLDGGDPAGAVECFQKATGILEEYAPAHYQLGRAWQRLGRRDAARLAFARAHQLNPSLAPPDDPDPARRNPHPAR
jgi:tetratricopeptide (TPR) repeat protein